MKVTWPGERLGNDARAYVDSVAIDELSVSLVRPDVRQTCNNQRIAETQQNRGGEGHEDCGDEIFFHRFWRIANCSLHASPIARIITSMILIPINGTITPPTPYIKRLRRSSASALMGLYLTPRRASGISTIMISALKITADKTADCGVARRMMLRVLSTGNVPANIAGIMAKYLATSLAMEKVVSEPRVINNCLPISTISSSLVGLESRSTMFPASLAA